MEILIIIISGVVVFLWYDSVQKKKKAKAIIEAQILDIASRTQKLFDKFDKLKTNTAKVNNCETAIATLKQAENFPEYREVITNYDELMHRLNAMQKVFPVVDYVDKSYKFKFKNKEKSELNALQDALYEIRQRGITDRDFEVAMVFPEGTGEIITIAGIKSRCEKLGWKP